MGVFIRKKNQHLYIDYRFNGRRHWEALHLTLTKDANHNCEALRLAEIIRSRASAPSSPMRRPSPRNRIPRIRFPSPYATFVNTRAPSSSER